MSSITCDSQLHGHGAGAAESAHMAAARNKTCLSRFEASLVQNILHNVRDDCFGLLLYSLKVQCWLGLGVVSCAKTWISLDLALWNKPW